MNIIDYSYGSHTYINFYALMFGQDVPALIVSSSARCTRKLPVYTW